MYVLSCFVQLKSVLFNLLCVLDLLAYHFLQRIISFHTKHYSEKRGHTCDDKLMSDIKGERHVMEVLGASHTGTQM